MAAADGTSSGPRRRRAAGQGVGPDRARGREPASDRRRCRGAARRLAGARRTRADDRVTPATSRPTQATTASRCRSPWPRSPASRPARRDRRPGLRRGQLPRLLGRPRDRRGAGRPRWRSHEPPAAAHRRRVPRPADERHPRRAARRAARLDTKEVNRDLARRQHGYGSGRRMLIEKDRVEWTRGPALRPDARLSPRLHDREPRLGELARAHVGRADRRRASDPSRSRWRGPGHADLAGAIKYDTTDIRNVLERASARSTAPRVAAGAVCAPAARRRRRSHLELRRPARRRACLRRRGRAGDRVPAGWVERDRVEPIPAALPRRRPPRSAMRAEVDRVIEAGDSIGGSFVVVAEGVPIGLGSQRRVGRRGSTRRSPRRLMGVQAVKGVEIGLGLPLDRAAPAAHVHDEVDPDRADWARRIEPRRRPRGRHVATGCRSSCAPRSSRSPRCASRSTRSTCVTGLPGRAHIERSDVAILPRAAVVGEAMVALVLADALLTSFGGDTIDDLRAAVRRRRARSPGPRGHARAPRRATARPRSSALPDECGCRSAAGAARGPGADA